ncbi:MAG: hypothetical protein A2Y40_02205 [Candidatus Margulisbacteria bacterium GWF2_35_9]|nr:MAG: hypothetical protein A2Y40_02205 [Candidatus Margulisbacteria bacterium GWF2_35_9]
MNKKIEDFYSNYLQKDIEKIDAPKTPYYLWSRIKEQVQHPEVKKPFLYQPIFKHKMAFAYMFIGLLSLSFFSFNKYQNYCMNKEVNGYLASYISFLSSDTSFTNEIKLESKVGTL